MDYLLDTHTFLWFINGDKQLSAKAKKIITNTASDKYLSVASFWEMAIKLNLGKLKLDISLEDLSYELVKNGFNLLPISIEHIFQLSLLELHHRDPFDRMIIAQAITEDLTFISKDDNFDKYSRLMLTW